MIENRMLLDNQWKTERYDEEYEEYLNEKADREYDDYIFNEMMEGENYE